MAADCLNESGSGGVEDPDQYVLTLPDGRVLQISKQLGLQQELAPELWSIVSAD